MDVQTMELDEQGAYLVLICHAWLNAARLPNDNVRLRRLLKNPPDKYWGRIQRFVLHKFTPSEDGKWLVNKRLMEIHEEVLEKAENYSRAAKKRWENKTHGKLKSDADATQIKRTCNEKKGKEKKRNNTPPKGTPQGVVNKPSFKQMSEEGFKREVVEIGSCQYDEGMLIEFIRYWTEPSSSGRMRFQLQKTWETSRRLANWQRNKEDWGKTKPTPTRDPNAQHFPDELMGIEFDEDNI